MTFMCMMLPIDDRDVGSLFEGGDCHSLAELLSKKGPKDPKGAPREAAVGMDMIRVWNGTTKACYTESVKAP